MAKTSITMRIDDGLKHQLQELLSNLGMDMTTFFTVSAAQAVREQRIPFEITMDAPNTETKEALREVEIMKKNPDAYKGYEDVDEMMKELLS